MTFILFPKYSTGIPTQGVCPRLPFCLDSLLQDLARLLPSSHSSAISNATLPGQPA